MTFASNLLNNARSLILALIVAICLVILIDLRQIVAAGVRNAAAVRVVQSGILSRTATLANSTCTKDPSIELMQSMLTWALTVGAPRGGTYALLGQISQRSGCLPEAIRWLNAGIEVKPTNPFVVKRLGELYKSASDLDAAVRVWSLYPELAVVHVREGYLAAATHDWDRSRAEFQLAIKIAPESAEAHYALGESLAYYDPRNEAAAIAEYEQAIRLGYNDPYVWSRLAHAYALAGQLSEAVKILDAHEQDNALANALRGEAYRMTAKSAQAVEAYRLSLQQYDLDPWVYTGLGRAYQQMGNLSQAKDAWRRALEISPGFGPAADALREVEGQ